MINNVIDFYDDNGFIFKKKVAHFKDIPETIKTAEFLTPVEMNKLPDDVFALVAFDATNKKRKLACVDSGNTALSVIYFMENKDKLPYEVQKVAAINLLQACKWYNLEPPNELRKIAILDKKDNKELTKITDLFGSYEMPVSKPKEKESGLLRSDQPKARDIIKGKGPTAREARSIVRDKLREGCPILNKTSSLHPYINVTNLHSPIQSIKETGNHFCLNGKYPIDTILQIEKAASYFSRHKDCFSPFERHQYCTKLASRASELGVKIPQEIQRYGSTKIAQDAHVGIYQRQRLFREGTSEYGLLEELREKYAAIKPEVLATILENFDKKANIYRMWDKEIPDPYYTVFGMEKIAEWSFVDRNDYINEERLRKCSTACRKELIDVFGEDLVKELEIAPIQIFDSLPLDHKRIIMRISQAVEE